MYIRRWVNCAKNKCWLSLTMYQLCNNSQCVNSSTVCPRMCLRGFDEAATPKQLFSKEFLRKERKFEWKWCQNSDWWRGKEIWTNMMLKVAPISVFYCSDCWSGNPDRSPGYENWEVCYSSDASNAKIVFENSSFHSKMTLRKSDKNNLFLQWFLWVKILYTYLSSLLDHLTH